MSIGEYEVIGDSDLVQSKNREYSLKCTSLEGELLVIKREYFEEKIFKYQDTFNEILKRCNNQNSLLSQRIENIQNQVDLLSKQQTNKIFNKKERSFTNLITDKQGIDRKLPDSPTQERKRQFEYHKKTMIHSNIQNCTDDIILLPKIHQSTYHQENSQIYPKSTTNHSVCYSPEKKYFQSSQSNQDNTTNNPLLSQSNKNKQDSKNLLVNSQFSNNSNKIKSKKNTISDDIKRQEIIYQKGTINDGSIKGMYQNEYQTQDLNKYYEPQEYQKMNQQKSRDIRLIKNKRSLQVSLEQEQHNQSPDIYRKIITPNSIKTLDSSIGNQSKENKIYSLIDNSNNQKFDQPILIDGFNQSSKRKIFDRENTKSVQGKQVTSHFRSISQQEVSSQVNEIEDMLPQSFFQNQNKIISKGQNGYKNQEATQENQKTRNHKKQLLIPQLNLQEQSYKQKGAIQNSKNNKNSKNGNHTERISSIKEEEEKVFMDSTYGYFLKKEQAAQQVLSERYNHKPVLIEIKQTESNKIEQNKKKIEKYHQQPMSQQEKILQTLIFSNKKIKKHLFSKILGDEYPNLQNFDSQHSDQIKGTTQNNRQDKYTQNSNYIGSDISSLNGILTSDYGMQRSKDAAQCNYYYLNNGFDLFQKESITNVNSAISQNNQAQLNIESVKIISGHHENQLNNQQFQQPTLKIKDLSQQQQQNMQISDSLTSKFDQIRDLENISSQTQKGKYLQSTHNHNIRDNKECFPEKIKRLGESEKYEIKNYYSVLKNNINIYPEIVNFNLESESKYIFEQYQFLDSIRDSQKYKIGSASVQNRFFKKTMKKMQETRRKINKLNQSDMN